MAAATLRSTRGTGGPTRGSGCARICVTGCWAFLRLTSVSTYGTVLLLATLQPAWQGCSSASNARKYFLVSQLTNERQTHAAHFYSMCSTTKPLGFGEMMHFKYQLLVDGHGPGYDSNIWKLLSGGTPFIVS